MRSRILWTLLFGLLVSAMYAQESQIEVGATFIIEDVENNKYKHIDFPKTNFIIKKGGVANYKKIKGQEVVVTSIKEHKDGRLVATIKLASEKFFFNSHKYLKVDINEAIAENELRAI